MRSSVSVMSSPHRAVEAVVEHLGLSRHLRLQDLHVGDTVEIRESRPHSKTKRWELVRIISKSRLVDIAAMRAADREESEA